jgi:hypothetical protein
LQWVFIAVCKVCQDVVIGVVVFINSTDIADKKAFSKKELSISGKDKTNIHKHHSIIQSFMQA